MLSRRVQSCSRTEAAAQLDSTCLAQVDPAWGPYLSPSTLEVEAEDGLVHLRLHSEFKPGWSKM